MESVGEKRKLPETKPKPSVTSAVSPKDSKNKDSSDATPAISVPVPGKTTATKVLEVTPLGGGSEVGRSCILLQFAGKNILLDCGVHPAFNGMAALPFFDTLPCEASEIDLLLITHFHLDHCGALPYFMTQTSFKGRVFMTHPTRAILSLILSDYVHVSDTSVEEQLYTAEDLAKCVDRIETINYHQEFEVAGVKFFALNAGHVLGAAMFQLDIDGIRILYTGDYSREEDRHLMSAELPPVPPDVLIVESTFGKQVHQPRLEREAQLTQRIRDIVKVRRGRCLMPVFALGRAQELLLIMDEYWDRNPDLQHVPIYYGSALAKKCMAVFQTYTNMMNDRIRHQIAVSNPFRFKYISNLRSLDQFDDVGPSVVMCSPGMLQSGMSRELFETWCGDKRNGLVLTGYSVNGTLATHVVSEPKEITTMSGLNIPLRMTVDYISFAAHCDFRQTSEFIGALEPPHVILVHGETQNMQKLKGALANMYREKDMEIYSPKNTQVVQITFTVERTAKAVGQIASGAPEDGASVSGVLVRKDFTHTFMAPQDLRAYTQLSTLSVSQTLRLPFYQRFEMARDALLQVFDDVRETTSAHLRLERMIEKGIQPDVPDEITVAEGVAGMDVSGAGTTADDEADDEYKGAKEEAKPALVLRDGVTLTRFSDTELVLEWNANPVTDMIADAVSATILSLQTGVGPALASFVPASKRARKDDEVDVDRQLIRDRCCAVSLTKLLKKVYGNVMLDEESAEIQIGDGALIRVRQNNVVAEDEQQKVQLTKLLQRMRALV